MSGFQLVELEIQAKGLVVVAPGTKVIVTAFDSGKSESSVVDTENGS